MEEPSGARQFSPATADGGGRLLPGTCTALESHLRPIYTECVYVCLRPSRDACLSVDERRRASTDVDACLRPSTRPSTRVDGRRHASTHVEVRRRASTTDVDARLRRYGTHAKRPVRSHRAHLRPSTDVDALGVYGPSPVSSSCC